MEMVLVRSKKPQHAAQSTVGHTLHFRDSDKYNFTNNNNNNKMRTVWLEPDVDIPGVPGGPGGPRIL